MPDLDDAGFWDLLWRRKYGQAFKAAESSPERRVRMCMHAALLSMKTARATET